MRPVKRFALASLVVGGLVLGTGLMSHIVAPVQAQNENPSVTIPPDAQAAIQAVEARIDRYEAFYLKQFHANPPDRSDQLANETTLGGLLLYDKTLSVKRNDARAFCHIP
jgi:hypothetical protein